jgi:threonine aldolase
MGEGLMRVVTHLDVTTEQVAEAAAAVKAVVEAA